MLGNECATGWPRYYVNSAFLLCAHEVPNKGGEQDCLKTFERAEYAEDENKQDCLEEIQSKS